MRLTNFLVQTIVLFKRLGIKKRGSLAGSLSFMMDAAGLKHAVQSGNVKAEIM
jgi:hypothetical protein